MSVASRARPATPARRDAAVTESPAPAPAPASPARVLRQFRVVFNAVKSHFQQVEKQVGLGGAQVWALSVVDAQPGIGVSELARAMDIHQTTASNLVKALVGRGLLAAQRAEDDRRAVRLHLLPPARDVLATAPGPFAGVLPEALAGLDPETLARLAEDLDRLIGQLRADPRAAGIPLADL